MKNIITSLCTASAVLAIPSTLTAGTDKTLVCWVTLANTTQQGGRLILSQNGELIAAARKMADGSATPAMPADPPADWLTYHLLHPGPGGAMPGDPNCAFYWKGVYHLHYIYNHKDGFAFAHVSSKDLVHWKWHPTSLFPRFTGHGMFSGAGSRRSTAILLNWKSYSNHPPRMSSAWMSCATTTAKTG